MTWLLTISRLDAIKGGITELDDDARSKLGEILRQNADQMLRAGVSISATEWAKLTIMERAAFVDASDAIWTERACEIGMASQDGLSTARVLSQLDGGEAHDELVMELVADAAVRTRRHG